MFIILIWLDRLDFHNVSLIDEVSGAYPMLDVVLFSKKQKAASCIFECLKFDDFVSELNLI